MSIASRGLYALSKLFTVILLLGAFAVGVTGVVYMSLSGNELKVPEIVGKDFVETEKELAAMGLRLKKRADRPSTEKINTIIEQLPKAGETVKTGQMILVVVSKAGLEGEVPPPLPKTEEEDDSKKIEEMISEKPKKARTPSNSNKKKADTSRDTADSNSNSNSSDEKGEKGKESDTKSDGPKKDPAGGKEKKNDPAPKPQNSPGVKPPPAKPAARDSQ